MPQPIYLAQPAPAQIHRVSHLTLQAFRNYDMLELNAGEESVVLTGHNGAGKTNILEAISFLAPGRGLRRAKLADVDSKLLNLPWAVSAIVQGRHGEVRIGSGRDGEATVDRRKVRADGTDISHTELSDYVSLLWLTPQMDQLFLEGGTARRKFLDRLVYGFDPTHATRVNAYDYAMRERNRLLEEQRADPVWLSGLEQKMAEHGVAIAIARLEAIQHINAMMQSSILDFPKAELALGGVVETELAEGNSALATEEAYRKMLHESRAADAAAGRSLTGVHRSELSVTHLEKHMEAAFCSTGEQKALLLSIILAEARASKHWHGVVPILLLDEVAAHLDPQKRQQLYQEIQALGAQAWMTGVSRDLFKEMHDKCIIFEVEKGRIFS